MSRSARKEKLYPYVSKPPKCRDCKRPLPSSAARVSILGGWYCPDCAIVREQGEGLARLPQLPRGVTKTRLPQREQLPGLEG
jgi:hypothetical protein